MNTGRSKSDRTSSSPRSSKNLLVKVLGILCLGVLLWVSWSVVPSQFKKDSQPENNSLLFTVTRGPLTVSVTESGTVDNREKIVVKSKVEGKTTILSLVSEGTHVQKGDLIIELDASSLEDERTKQQITLLNSEAAYIHARETLDVTRSEGESNIAKARLEYTFAKADLNKYLNGEYPQEKQKAEANITIAKEEFQRAEEKLEWSQRLHEEGHITRSELEADALAAKRKQLEVELAKSELELLGKYTHKRKLDELENNRIQTELAHERTKRKTAADNIQAEANLKAKKSEFERQLDQLDKINKKIFNCRIKAPVGGMVVYATSSSMRWRGQEEPLQEGQDVREGQELIHLPTNSSMMVEVKIHESSLTKVRVGLPVVVTVDALPGQRFIGKVGRIALLPDATSAWLNPDLKVYSTEIYLDGDGGELRTGMTCQCKIIVEEYEDTIYIPLQSVVRVGGQTVVYVADSKGRTAGNAVQPKPVKIGLDNNRMIRIVDGLSVGDEVLLTPPLTRSEAPVEKLLLDRKEKNGRLSSGITIKPLQIEIHRTFESSSGISDQPADKK